MYKCMSMHLYMCMYCITRYGSSVHNYRDCCGCSCIIPYIRKYFLLSVSIEASFGDITVENTLNIKLGPKKT